ncbi:hypothetical protein [Lederbergia citri]|uniref:Uncharacterized protein n=1 Tax=Lederbergia citri TaxID=2833580 RepID=A0A942YHS5_9BACI|nr:hypothetical protein [Lederbergia citri]MBS4196129.1 hypothetical protein [Lederbergia citri]
MFFFLETEVKHRIYELQKESEKQRLLQKKKASISNEPSLTTSKPLKKPTPIMSTK